MNKNALKVVGLMWLSSGVTAVIIGSILYIAENYPQFTDGILAGIVFIIVSIFTYNAVKEDV